MILDDNLSGFRSDLIFTVRQLTENIIEYDESLYLCFIDLEKAFDNAPKQWSQGTNLL